MKRKIMLIRAVKLANLNKTHPERVWELFCKGGCLEHCPVQKFYPWCEDCSMFFPMGYLDRVIARTW